MKGCEYGKVVQYEYIGTLEAKSEFDAMNKTMAKLYDDFPSRTAISYEVEVER